MTLEQLERIFDESGIDFSEPGFYDLPAFTAKEEDDPVFLATYAEYVHTRRYSGEYLEHVREIVPRLAGVVFAELQAAQLGGPCVDASNALVRMLEKESVWSCSVSGGVTVTYPRSSKLSQSHFAPIAQRKIAAGHMWVFAPPFRVVDITLPIQGWSPARAPYFSGPVIQEESRAADPTVFEILDVNIIYEFQMFNGRMPRMQDIPQIAPNVFPMMERFPAFQVQAEKLLIKYKPVNFRASNESLDDLPIPRGI